MDDYKFIEKIEGEHVLLNFEGEAIPLSDIFVDMYVGEDGSNAFGKEESQIAEYYNLDENQVAEAQIFFREDEDFLTDFSYSKTAETVFEAVDTVFYQLSALHDDVEKEMADNPDEANVFYRLNIGEDTLQADIERDHAYLSHNNTDVITKVRLEDIENQIKVLYNDIRLQNG